MSTCYEMPEGAPGDSTSGTFGWIELYQTRSIRLLRPAWHLSGLDKRGSLTRLPGVRNSDRQLDTELERGRVGRRGTMQTAASNEPAFVPLEQLQCPRRFRGASSAE